jgi:hypothetical protein
MDVIRKAAATLTATEDKLRRLLAEAAQSGDYDAVLRLTLWAQKIHELVASHATDVQLAGEGGSTRPEPGPAVPPAALPRLAPDRRSSRKRAYPFFTRDRDDLVKTGWSKKNGKEYHHRAPRRVLDIVADEVVAEAHKGQPITTAVLFPMADGSGGTLPDYQVYVCLAWMKAEGMLLPSGRQGYEVVEPSQLAQRINDRWKQID